MNTADDIINTIDPDKWRCDNCHKWYWNSENHFITLKLLHNLMKICYKCWKSKLDLKFSDRKKFFVQKNEIQ